MTRLPDSKLHPASASLHSLHFHKLQGAGNDFVVLDLLAHPLPADFDFPRAARALCDRHLGAGGDGLLTLEAPTAGDTDGSAVRMRMWNPDGSEDMCGNGLRCVAHLAWLKKIGGGPIFRVQTLVGARQIEVLKSGWIRAEMGAPSFEPSQIPLAMGSKNKGENASQNALDIEIALPDRSFAASCLSTGSTHTVIFLPAPLSDADFYKFGPLLEHHPLFPTRTSVMFAVPSGEARFDLRIWERGAGETWACGTGACAVGVAAQMTGRARGPIQIRSQGGTLEVQWTPNEAIFLTGPARAVFEARGDFRF